MRIAQVDVFYLALPTITDAADGTQDSVLVRVRDEKGREGWGECDASPLVTIAAYVCPTSHGNIQSLSRILVGQWFESPNDVRRIAADVHRRALDVEQVHHAFSGAEIAMWDLLGKARGEPVWKLLEEGSAGTGGARAHPKLPYASVLFADTPKECEERARSLRARGFRAAKFGWGPLGSDEALDLALVRAARAGLGSDAELMIDAGCAWGEEDETAHRRAALFAETRPTWLEEPLSPDAVAAYRRLRDRRAAVPIACGEGANRYRFAEDLIENAGLGFIQIDAGRIGGLDASWRVRRLAEARGIVYVNHTFKSHLSLAAALHVFATAEPFHYLEYPAGGSALSDGLVENPLLPGPDGLVRLHDAPGIGVTISRATVKRFLRDVEIRDRGAVIYRTPSVE